MPTLQDVARKAGVSTATVSKVLSNTPYFTEATREKVLRAVAEVGYVPNLAARALSNGRTNVIAFVFPYLQEGIFEDPNILRILEGVEAACRERGLNILLASPRVNGDDPDAHYRQLVQSGYVDGFIVFDPLPFASALEDIRKRGLPAVGITHRPTEHFIVEDDYEGGRALMAHLLALGHRRIALIAVSPSLHFGVQKRLAGMRAAVEAVGLDFDALPLVEGDFSTVSGTKAAEHLLTAHPELTAYVALNDRMAMGAIQAVRARGWRVPADVSVVGYDDIPMAAWFAPSLTTVNQQAYSIGQRATQMLDQILNHDIPESACIPAQLVIRESSAAPRQIS